MEYLTILTEYLKTPKVECILLGSKLYMTFEEKYIPVSRVMCILAHGPSNLLALHKCGKGNLGCINPDHLYWGSIQKNMDDQYTHGVRAMGEKHGRYNPTLPRHLKRYQR